MYIGRDGRYVFAADSAPRTPPLHNSTTSRTLNLKSEFDISIVTDIWDESFEPESPPPLPVVIFDGSFDEDLKIAREEFDLKLASGPSEPDFGECSDSEYSSTAASENIVKEPTSINQRKEISATIFHGTTSIPITIIVTTPIEETPHSLDDPPVLQRHALRFPGASRDVDPFQNVNPSLLMPPTDTQLDPRKLRKAQEFREIRKWLITVLNSKGDQFPRKLRLRMMDIYCIRDFDLSPGMIAKFNAEVHDEYGPLRQQDEGIDDARSLSILGAAFRSQIEAVSPRMEKVVPLPVPPSRQRQLGPARKLDSKKQELAKVEKVRRPETLSREEPSTEFLPSWLGPLISTSTSSGDSLLSDQQYLKRAYSAPNLKASRPNLASTDSTHSVPSMRPRGSTLAGEDIKTKQSGNKRSSFISGAFGAMRDAMKSKQRELSKKRSWDGR
jgi:hypothetical protein